MKYNVTVSRDIKENSVKRESVWMTAMAGVFVQMAIVYVMMGGPV